MLSSYRHLLSRPGAAALSSSGLLARMPVAVLDVALILVLVSSSHSFAVAGTVSAVFALAQAVGSPVLSRLVDRHGARRVMFPALLAHTLVVAGLLVAATLSAPLVVLFAVTALAGLLVGSIGSLIRARWDQVLKDDEGALHTAFSLESILDEVVMLAGPILVALVATAFSPIVGVGMVAVAGLVGGLLFLAQPQAAPSGPVERVKAGSLRGLGRLALAGLALGMFFAAIDLTAVAVADEADKAHLTGVLLAALAAGSLVGGIVYGARSWRMPQQTQMRLGGVLLAVGAGVLFLVESVWLVALTALVTGLLVSPVMITSKTLVRSTVPSERLGEALTWVSSAGVLGFAVGGVLAGSVVTLAGAHAGYLVAMAGALTAAACTLGRKALLPDLPSQRVEEPQEAAVKAPSN